MDYHEETMMAKRLPPVHPGEILREEFLPLMQVSQYRLSLQAQYDLDVESDRIGDRIEREITPQAM